MTDLFGKLTSTRPTSAQIREQQARGMQDLSIQRAQQTADAALAEPPIGTVTGWGGALDPPGGKWLLCNGRVLTLNEYPDLYNALGTTWNTGGEASSQFRIPDLRSRAIVGAGQGALLTNRPLASQFGTETHTLVTNEVPVHTHVASTDSPSHNHGGTLTDSHNHGGNTGGSSQSLVNTITVEGRTVQAGTGTSVAQVGGFSTIGHTNVINSDTHSHGINSVSHSHVITVDSVGGGAAHNNLPPSIALNQIIRVRL